MAIHFVYIALGVGKVGLMIAKSDAITETARHFTQKAHKFYPNRVTQKALDILDHDDTKHVGIVLKDGITFDNVKAKLENLGDMAIPVKDGSTATTIKRKDDTKIDVDFVVIAREDVKDAVVNTLLGDTKEIINFTPTQPVTALGHVIKSASNLLPNSVTDRLPNFLKRTN